tara:strand:+ start:56 stop:1003 length:948 start_codon:yes stop_codon:yes gene_type:complete
MKVQRIRILLIALVFVFPLLSSCSSEEDSSSQSSPSAVGPETTPTSAPTPTPAANVDNTDTTSKPYISVPTGEPPIELLTEDIVEGSGDPVGTGDFLIMQYVGVSYSTGLQFDASWDRGQPFSFELGSGNVIAGWDEGIEGMSPGGRRLLTIPPEKAYGENGSGSGSIGPNETLLFVVDLLAAVPVDLEKPTVSIPDQSATELEIRDIEVGTGRSIEDGDVVYVHYAGYSQSTGSQFDASWDRGRPQFIGFVIGQGNVIDGWEEGLLGMQVGGRRELTIPSDLAYGEDGAGGGLIAPNETLIFVIDLLGAYPYSN